MSGDPPRQRPRFPAGLQPAAAAAERRPQPLRPQRPLAEAARDAQRRTAPTGLGLDTAAVRQRMIVRLRADGISCAPVLQAMSHVPRHVFVDSALAAQAYEDTSLPIGLGQTISKPSVVARMLEWLMLGDTARAQGHLGRVLEVGTGCGYQTAVLCALATSVVSVERLLALHELACRHLSHFQLPVPCTLVAGDGMLGHAEAGPFDSIIAAAGGEDIPLAWMEQLAVGGRIVAPARAPNGLGQVLIVVDRLKDGWRRTVGEAVQFVPLKSGVA
nr:protein-L-isoaspartate O-methyltransferase [Ideonella livida]